MKIKKHDANEYLLTEDGVWVRDLCKGHVRKTDINQLSDERDYPLFLRNEIANRAKELAILDRDSPHHTDIVIVSSGYGFAEKQEILAKLPRKEVTLIGVNRSLANWTLLGDNPIKRTLDWFLVNNPYPESLKYLPTKHRYFPKCIVSNRTHPSFTEKYEGNLYTYSPVVEREYAGPAHDNQAQIDEYRNPICAAIGVAWLFNVRRLLLFCCDDSFEGERPGAEQLDNGLWSYPQQQMSQRIIDANLYWLKQQEIEVADFSAGRKLENATYIQKEEDVLRFFDKGKNGEP